MRTWLLRVCVFVASLLAIAELMFHTIIPARSLPRSVYLDQHQLAVMDRSRTPTGLSTYGNLAQQRVRWHVNNRGWNSDEDYFPASERNTPLIAVIGDSYIEGLTVPAEDNIPVRLRRHVSGQYAVYGFGRGGANLAHYITMARYAREEFDPEMFVIFLVANDLRDSLYNLGSVAMATQLKYERGGFVVLPQECAHSYTQDGASNLLLQFAEMRWHSALYRYLIFNKGMNGLLFFDGNKRLSVPEAPKLPPGMSSDELMKLAAEELIHRLRANTGEGRVLVVLDAQRAEIYRTGGQKAVPRFAESAWVEEACVHHSCDFMDLTDVFLRDYRERGQRFNFSFDYHWNAYGRDLIAAHVAQRLMMNGARLSGDSLDEEGSSRRSRVP